MTAKKTPKNRTPDQTPQKERKDVLLTRKQSGIILLVLGIFLVVFILGFLYARVLKVQSLRQIFPSDRTALLLEMPMDIPDVEMRSVANILLNLPAVNTHPWKALITGRHPWLKQLGLAFVLSDRDDPDQRVYPMLAGKVSDKNAALERFAELDQSDAPLLSGTFERFPVYAGNQLAVAFIGDFFLLSNSSADIQSILSLQTLETRRIEQDTLTKNGSNGKAFEKTPNIAATFLPALLGRPLLEEFNLTEFSFSPLLSSLFLSYESGATDMYLEPHAGLLFETILLPNDALSSAKKERPLRGKFRAAFLDRFPSGPIQLLGGADLESQWKRWTAFMNAHFDGATEQTLFGQDLNIEEDLMPFTQNEYTFAVYSRENEYQYLFAAEGKDLKSLNNAVEKLMEKFALLAPFLNPQIQEVTLESGVIGKELVQNPNASDRISLASSSGDVIGVQLRDKSWGLFATVKKNQVFISSHLELLRESMAQDSNKSFRHSEDYKVVFSRVLAASNTASFMDLELWWKSAYQEDLPAWLKAFPKMAVSTREQGSLTELTTFAKFR